MKRPIQQGQLSVDICLRVYYLLIVFIEGK
jgi:hypothetical protein